MTAHRRTQDERSAETRRRLLDATIECLVEHGYANLTTARVVRRAGVTRGAQAHHFHTKADLVTAAVRHLATRRTELALEQVGRILRSQDPIGDMLDLVWEVHSGPMFTATVELWLAARTDPVLRDQMAVVEPATTGSLTEFARGFFDDAVHQRALRDYIHTVLDTVRGVLVSGFADLDDRRQAQRWARAKAELRLLAEAVMAAHGVGLNEVVGHR